MQADFSSYLERIEKEIDSILPQEPSSAWLRDSFGNIDQAVNSTHVLPLTEPNKKLISLGGKRWRPLLLVLTAEAALEKNKASEENKAAVLERAYHLTPLVEFIHTASLIHDDIEDSSDTRRGEPAAHITYGMDVALNAGTWLMLQSATVIQNLDASDSEKKNLYELFLKETRKLHLGQAMDICWHRNIPFMPSAEEYLAMVRSKTGTLSSLAAKLGSLVSACDEESVNKAGSLAADIGAGFQIIDDVINLTTGNVGKKRGDDIVEGKKSLPVILFMQKNSGNEKAAQLTKLIEQAKKEGIDSPAVEEAIKLLIESGSVEEARLRGIKAITEGCSSFEKLFGSSKATEKVTGLFTNMIPKTK